MGNTSWSETRIVNEQGRQTGHFCLAVELGVACLRRGRALAHKSRGHSGLIEVRWDGMGHGAAGDDGLFHVSSERAGGRDFPISRHIFPRDAVEHFVSLVGEKAALKAIQHAACHNERFDGSHDPFMVECLVAERSARHGLGKDTLSYGHFATRGNTRKWAFIARYSVLADGGTNTGADLDFTNTLEQAVAEFHSQVTSS